MKKVFDYIPVLLLSACVMCCMSCLNKCEPGETQPGYCSDGTVVEQVCKDDGSGWKPAECTNKYSFWNDPATQLTWPVSCVDDASELERMWGVCYTRN